MTLTFGRAIIGLAIGAVAAPLLGQQPGPAMDREALMRVPADAPPPRMPPQGPYQVEVLTDPTLPTHTLYRPKLPVRGKLPVVAWGNGGCSNSNATARAFLTTVASHGFLVIAPGPRDAAERGSTKGAVLRDALNWAEAENKRGKSRYRGRLDAANAAVMGYSCGGLQAVENSGDARVKTVVLFDSGVFDRNTFMDRMSTASMDDLQKLRKPIAYFIGGPTDVAFRQAEDNFRAIQHAPVFKANINTGHPGTFAHPGGGWFAEAAAAWLKWTLKGDRTAGTYFAGRDCKLCVDPVWSIERKNISNRPPEGAAR